MNEKGLYVRCTVSQGLFKAEYYVVVGTSSAFVAAETVRVARELKNEQEVIEGSVLVYLIQEDHKRDEALVELPGEPVLGGLRTWVPRKLVENYA